MKWIREKEKAFKNITTGQDKNKTDSPHSSEVCIYRTAFKLRSAQTLCQLDLVSSTLVQEVLLHPRVWKASAGSLSVPQLFQALQELFQRARVETRGQVQPRASELTLSLLMAMFDSPGVGVLKLLPVVAALIALSGDSPLTKYRALFQLYAENNKGSNESRARITRRVLRNLLTDIQQIPTVVGESRTLSSVDSAVRSCFQGVLSSGIKEERFLSWAQSEPVILQWLPTCYQLSVTEMVTHPVRCSICRTFPITGLRYRCLKCLNFDICQACFFSDVHSQSHQKSHPVIEHCVQMSAKENTKLLLRTLRNNLLRGRWQRKGDPRRLRLLNQVKSEHAAHHAHAQAKLLKTQLNQYKDKLQAIYTIQEEKSCRFEAKIQELTSNQDSLWAKIQQMRQDVQAMLQPRHPSSSHQHMVSKVDRSSADRSQKGRDSCRIKNVTEDGPGWKPLPDPILVDQSQANTNHGQPDSESPAPVAQTNSAQSYTRKTSKQILSSEPCSQQGLLQEKLQISPTEMTSTTLASTGRKTTVSIAGRKDELEEELQELLSKLVDAFSLEMPPGPQSSVNMDLYGGAERLCRAFSALVDQITSPNLK
ncbi:dystrotelin [Octodon degus]|uniref:Dystrotelin n=1 Tax=Octodon degus TaxID=10160 RepID=A0A6P6E0Z1_OCTDE|nr:dystrotelin [Octodon degus]